MQVLFLPCPPPRQMGEAGAAYDVSSSPFFDVKRGSTVIWTRSNLSASYEVKQLKEGKEEGNAGGMCSEYWRRTLHYDWPACFSCSMVSFEGSGFFSCVSVFFNFDLLNFSISAISGLPDVAEGVERAESKWSLVWSVLWPPRSAESTHFHHLYCHSPDPNQHHPSFGFFNWSRVDLQYYISFRCKA